jgi:GNAT superfamily N-acetyltransferase
MKDVQIRSLTEARDRETAFQLAERVFMKFEAPDYPEEGTAHFIEFLNNRKETDALEVFGAFVEGRIAGVIATRNQGTHISLFFVEETFQKQGIGKRLFETVRRRTAAEQITVHSSPYAAGIYRRLGFVKTGREQVVTGIRYIPMRFEEQID